jgi:hypothetical protein
MQSVEIDPSLPTAVRDAQSEAGEALVEVINLSFLRWLEARTAAAVRARLGM